MNDAAPVWREIDYSEARRIAGSLTGLGQSAELVEPGVYELVLKDWLFSPGEIRGRLRVIVPPDVEFTGKATPALRYFYSEP